MIALLSVPDAKVSSAQPGKGPTRLRRCLAGITPLLLAAASVNADYRDDIGYTLLVSELGSEVPNGAGVRVAHIEAASRVDDNPPAWMPNRSNPQFIGKTLTNKSFATPGIFSGHATGTGSHFYGNRGSISPGIAKVSNYLSTHWLGQGLLRTGSGTPDFRLQPRVSASRIGNHSWIGTTDAFDAEVLSRLDWIIDRDEFVQITGYTGSMTQPLLSNAYNVIAVNQINAAATPGSAEVGGIYTAGRTKPDLVVPASHTSQAVPKVASATALLIGAAHERPSLSTDPLQKSVTNRNGDTIFNAERAEVIKAALMAGAKRRTGNTSGADINDYRADSNNETENGLDRRFGAGQLNIYNSYRIIAAGEQNSREDSDENSGSIGPIGFDYDPAFGGFDKSNAQATYFFSTSTETARLRASLVWNLLIDGGSAFNFDQAATLHNLDLFLFDVTGQDNWVLISSSASTTENTENLWLLLDSGKDYALQVKPGSGPTSFRWDYALAWHIQPSRSAD